MVDAELMNDVLAGEFSSPAVETKPAQPWVPQDNWEEHDTLHVEDWMYEVACRNTRQSYVEWVNSQLESE